MGLHDLHVLPTSVEKRKFQDLLQDMATLELQFWNMTTTSKTSRENMPPSEDIHLAHCKILDPTFIQHLTSTISQDILYSIWNMKTKQNIEVVLHVDT